MFVISRSDLLGQIFVGHERMPVLYNIPIPHIRSYIILHIQGLVWYKCSFQLLLHIMQDDVTGSDHQITAGHSLSQENAHRNLDCYIKHGFAIFGPHCRSHISVKRTYDDMHVCSPQFISYPPYRPLLHSVQARGPFFLTACRIRGPIWPVFTPAVQRTLANKNVPGRRVALSRQLVESTELCMGKIPSWTVDSRTHNQQITRLLWFPDVHYRFQKIRHQYRTWARWNQFTPPHPNSLTCFNIILSSVLMISEWFLSFRLYIQNCVCTFLIHSVRATSPSNLILLGLIILIILNI